MRLIDADNLKKDLNVEFIFDNRDRYRIRDLIDIQATIEAEPVRRGRWKVWYHGEDGFSFNCTECGTPAGWRTKYCPSCGALMEEQE